MIRTELQAVEALDKAAALMHEAADFYLDHVELPMAVCQPIAQSWTTLHDAMPIFRQRLVDHLFQSR